MEGASAYQPKLRPEWQVVQNGENLLAAAGVRILHDQGDRAYYSLSSDQVHLPSKGAFPSKAQYYGTALHEVGHATGHPSRLNRESLTKSDGFGSPTYAREELRAELTSLFLAAERGIPHDPMQHAAYVGAWIKALQEDKNEIFRAARDASKAAEYLLEREQEYLLDHQNAQPTVIKENAEWVAVFNPQTGSVVITEKDTATQQRELYDPEPHSLTEGDSPARSQEQILDDQVHGEVAPHKYLQDAYAAAHERAKALVEQEMGNAEMRHALTDSGHYDGPIIGTTEDYAIQHFTSNLAILHDRDQVGDLAADPDTNIVIDYDRGTAEVTVEERHEMERDEQELAAELEN
jgi:hypothetical protein